MMIYRYCIISPRLITINRSNDMNTGTIFRRQGKTNNMSPRSIQRTTQDSFLIDSSRGEWCTVMGTLTSWKDVYGSLARVVNGEWWMVNGAKPTQVTRCTLNWVSVRQLSAAHREWKSSRLLGAAVLPLICTTKNQFSVLRFYLGP